MSNYESVLQEIQAYITQAKRTHDTSQVSFFFRGHARDDWNLVPNISRQTDFLERDVILNAMQDKHWENAQSLFSNLARMQHYGYKTRFLDFTTEVNNALYFAASDHETKDGSIWICVYDKRAFSCTDSTLIAELTLIDKPTPMKDFIDSVARKHPEILQLESWDSVGAGVLVWLNHGFMVTPSYEEYENLREWNPRLYNQKGVFFVFGNKTEVPYSSASTTEARSCVIMPALEKTPSIISKEPYAKKIKIPAEAKKDILRKLDLIGINRGFIYPDS